MKLSSASDHGLAVSTVLKASSFSVTPTIASEFSGIVTATSLIVVSTPSSSESSTMTLSDPDEATTSVSVATTIAATAAPSQAALPAAIPSTIFPPGGQPANPGADFTLITISLDDALPWVSVVNNDQSALQLLSWMQVIIKTALSVDGTFFFFC